MLVVIIEVVRRTVLSDYYTLTITNDVPIAKPFRDTKIFLFASQDDLFAFLSDDLAVIINDQLQPQPDLFPSPPGRGQGEGPTPPKESSMNINITKVSKGFTLTFTDRPIQTLAFPNRDDLLKFIEDDLPEIVEEEISGRGASLAPSKVEPA